MQGSASRVQTVWTQWRREGGLPPYALHCLARPRPPPAGMGKQAQQGQRASGMQVVRASG